MTKRRWTILLAAILLGVGLLWLVLGREPIQEGRCRLKLKRVGQPGGLTGIAYRFLDRPTSDSNGIRDLPEGFDKPYYYRVRANDAEIALVVNGTNPWTLCLDTDQDGLLSNEKLFQGKIRQIRDWGKDQRHYLFGPVELALPDESSARTTRFWLLGSRMDVAGQHVTELPRVFAIYPAGYRTGRLRIQGQAYNVAILDGDYDGLFSPVDLAKRDHMRRPVCDYFAIDLDKNGTFEQDLYQRNETRPLGRLVLLGGVYYAIDISGNGQELALWPIDPERGTLILDHADCEIQCRLWSDAADQWMTVPAGQKELSLPVGKYSMARVIVRAADASGSTLEAACTRDFGTLSLFEVKAGETTRLDIGPPFTCTPRVAKTDDGTVSIEPILTGRAGEEYSIIVKRNGKSVPAPAMTIVDEKGTVLETGKFEYG
ncbi:MAG: hypothetical protein KBE65_16090 [Phycisphaerae bacterium]|nr:hypothetical protein [Phycisphaerae bacterium]